MKDKIESFKDLRIWKDGVFLAEEIYRVTKKFPAHEIYGLSSQLRRAAVSIPSNIAEGSRRPHTKELKRFLSISLGSTAELETQLEIAMRVGYLEKGYYENICQKIQVLCRMIQTLLKRLK